MGFIFEKLNEEKRTYLEKFDIRHPFNSNLKVGLRDWVVDAEREVFLLPLTGGGYNEEHPEVLRFFYKENIGIIHAYKKKKFKTHTEVDVTWFLFEICFPTNLENEKEEILGLIKEAFLVYGSGRLDQKVDDFVFAEIADPIFVNDREGGLINNILKI